MLCVYECHKIIEMVTEQFLYDSKIPNLPNFICFLFEFLRKFLRLKKPKDAQKYAVFTDSLEDLEEMLLEGRKIESRAK